MFTPHTNSDETQRAGSPVIGVILMVGISVVLSTTIGVAFLGFVNDLEDTSPNVQLDVEQTNESMITVQHRGGESITTERIQYIYTGNSRLNTSDTIGDEITVGETVTVRLSDRTTFEPGETVYVVWVSESGRSSTILVEFTIY